MRLEFNPREYAGSVERLVDGFIFLSGGIFQLIDRVGRTATTEGFGGKVRLDFVTTGLLDHALEPLAERYSERDLEQAAEILTAAIERIGREFFAEQYAGSAERTGRGRAA